MKKYLYKDEPFYVKIKLSECFTYTDNYLIIYVKRTNIFRFIKKYKCVGGLYNTNLRDVKSRKSLVDLLSAAYLKIYKKEEVVECIECSPEIEELYKIN